MIFTFVTKKPPLPPPPYRQLRVEEHPIFAACCAGDYEAAARCISQDRMCIIDQVTSDGVTPFMYAAGSGNLRLVDMLLACGASEAASDCNGYTAACYAVARGHGRLAAYLNPMYLRKLAKHNLEKRFKQALDSGGFDLILNPMLAGSLAQYICSLHQTDERARMLAYMAAKVQPMLLPGVGIYHESLLIACSRGRARFVKALLETGARCVGVAHRGCTFKCTITDPAMYYAVRYGCPEVVELLLSHDRGGYCKPHHCLAWPASNNVASAEPSDADDEAGEPVSCLFVAVLADSPECVPVLARHGASLTATDPVFGYTPLHLAAAMGRLNVAKALLACSIVADTCSEVVNATADNGNTPLHLVCMNSGTDTMASLLLAHGANPWLTNNANNAPMKEACERENTPCVHAIIHSMRSALDGITLGSPQQRWVADKDDPLLANRRVLINQDKVSENHITDPMILLESMLMSRNMFQAFSDKLSETVSGAIIASLQDGTDKGKGKGGPKKASDGASTSASATYKGKGGPKKASDGASTSASASVNGKGGPKKASDGASTSASASVNGKGGPKKASDGASTSASASASVNGKGKGPSTSGACESASTSASASAKEDDQKICPRCCKPVHRLVTSCPGCDINACISCHLETPCPRRYRSKVLCDRCSGRIPNFIQTKCARCGAVRYCSTTCQASAWPEHKLVCVAPRD
jgi:ankyrin repeat protein